MRGFHGVLAVTWFLGLTTGLTACGEPTAEQVAPVEPDEPTPPAPPAPHGPSAGTEVPYAADDLGSYDFAYTSWGAGGAEIRVGNLAGEWSSVYPLEGGVLGAGTLALSPDGARLAYETYDADDIGWAVHVLTLATRADVKVGANAIPGMQPTWSPDGAELAYTSTIWPDPSQDGVTQTWIAASDGSGAARLVEDAISPYPPIWSTDATELYYVAARGIVARELASGSVRDLVPGEAALASPGMYLSPDGSALAFGRGSAVAIVPTAGGEPRWVATLDGYADHIAWRADGAALAVTDFSCPEVGSCGAEIVIVGLDGARTHVDDTHCGTGGGELAWSPDGALLLYTAFSWEDGASDTRLHVYAPAAPAESRDLGLVGASYDAVYPAWLTPVPDEQN